MTKSSHNQKFVTMNTIYQGSVNYGRFTTGKVIQEGKWKKISYWNGCNSIREGREYIYILLAGSHYVGNSLGFAEHIFRVPKGNDISYALKNIDTLLWDQQLIPGEPAQLISQEDYYN